MSMKYSDLKQRTFDHLFAGLALVDMLHRHELLEIATGLRCSDVDGDEKTLFLAVAYAVEAYANAEAQA